MVAAGCEPVFDMSQHSAMLLGAVKAVRQAITMLRISDEHLRRYPFDAAVVIDSPTLHLPLAARAQAVGVPILYYIAPQMWAWGAYRIHKLRNRSERVAVILPFEEQFFRDQGVAATYVGHPLAERIATTMVDETVVQEIRTGGDPVLALLPGSRKHVVREVLQGQLEVAREVASVFPQATFGVSVANAQVAPVVEALLRGTRLAVRPYADHYAELIRAADLVLVASGTTALEVAFHQRPMIVMYNASRLFYHLIGRWMIRTPYLSLPNILAGRKIVPEFMPYYRSTEPISKQAIALLQSEHARQRMVEDLATITDPIRDTRASERTADLLLRMIEETQH